MGLYLTPVHLLSWSAANGPRHGGTLPEVQIVERKTIRGVQIFRAPTVAGHDEFECNRKFEVENGRGVVVSFWIEFVDIEFGVKICILVKFYGGFPIIFEIRMQFWVFDQKFHFYVFRSNLQVGNFTEDFEFFFWIYWNEIMRF
jgi:hypothetical protein